MNKFSTSTEASVLSDLLRVAESLIEYVDAIPTKTVASFPAMPGIDRDWAEGVLHTARAALSGARQDAT